MTVTNSTIIGYLARNIIIILCIVIIVEVITQQFKFLLIICKFSKLLNSTDFLYSQNYNSEHMNLTHIHLFMFTNVTMI
ncbi:unnamed protein product [Brugia timori]|uniref:7TM_GPCR_Srx domain-containing protein n=1 Tax=Brugia timori TaxID=42155 RepID=A0A0R3QMN6_9BILA|nr:unnamed protein product [Brugia timori]